ncbi:MAG TPA: DUF692 domain-containing protein [Methylomirabilota bacterium]|nr:DUF692 domain-containing protein [Methylomirabilota bacterium]
MTGGDADTAGAPAAAGIGLRAPHVQEVITTRPPIAWLEVHAENYLGGGPTLRDLDQVRRDYPVSLHGVGLSLGSADGLDARHLKRLATLVGRVEPALVSEHLSWSITGGVYLNHLLPMPYTEESLELVCRHIDHVQVALGRQILVENPSSYLRFRHSPIPEPEFLIEVAQQTGCGLLCDVNNIYVSAHNLGFDAVAYVDALPRESVHEIHVAGHARNDADGLTILIDDHGSRVSPEVWKLYAHALAHLGPVATLVEWDTAIPALDVLLAEACVADGLLYRALPGTPHAATA